MKRIAIFLLTIALFISARSSAQQVTISGNNLNLKEVFAEVRKQTGYEFLHQSSLLKATKPVSLDAKGMNLDEVMKICLQGQGLGFIIRNKTIVIFREESIAGTEQPPDAGSSSGNIFVSGRVIDSRGVPVEMASVIFARANTGIQTNRSGFFSLKVKSLQQGDAVKISFVGLKSQEVIIGNKADLGEITLHPADNVLDELLVTAYGTTSERFRIGDIAKVDSKEIEKTASLNIVAALSGRVAGMYIRQNGGNPGSVYNVSLRGVNVLPPSSNLFGTDAINVLSKPLIVIDGLPMAPDVINETGTNNGAYAILGFAGASGGQDLLYWLNTLDVENVSVLKDAEATTLYGSRAANGVIIITTKKSKPGKTMLSVNINTGIHAQARRLKLLNNQQYFAMRREAWQNTMNAGLPVMGGLSFSYTPDAGNSYDMLVWDTTRYTDWQKELLGAAPVYNTHVELTGGEERTSYRVSASYNRWKSSFPSPGYAKDFGEEKGTFSFSVSSRSKNNRFKMTTAIMPYILSSHEPGHDPSSNIFLAPNAPSIFDARGDLNFKDWRPASPLPALITGNPFQALAIPYTSKRFGLQGRINLSYELFHSLVFSIGAGALRSEGRQTIRLPRASADPLISNFNRQAFFGNATATGLNIEPELRYTKTFKRHYISLLAGGSFQSDKQDGTVVIASGYTADELMNTQVGAASITNGYKLVQRNSLSAFGRLSYRYANRYLVDLSARRDGSSSFSKEHRFGNFGSVGAGWIFTDERWMRSQSVLTFGKLRASYGSSGSQSANPYAYLSTFNPAGPRVSLMPYFIFMNGSGVYQNVPAFSVTRVANPDYGWAQATSVDLGADLYFLKQQRLQLTIQWYQKTISDQLVYQPVSTITGTAEYLMNLPAKVRNSGIETVLHYKNDVRPSGFSWDFSVNLSFNRNRLLAYPRLEDLPQKSYYEIGQPLVRQQLYRTYLDRALGVYTIVDSLNIFPVAYRINDLPVMTGGVQTSVSYKRLTLSLSFTFAAQKGFINVQGAGYPGTLETYAKSNQVISVIRDRHWQSGADSTIGGAFLATDRAIPSMDINWGDASYIAVKNASLEYVLPNTWLRRAHISGLCFYINAENLLFIPLSGYKGVNPEQPGLSGQLPLRKTLVGGFRINL